LRVPSEIAAARQALMLAKAAAMRIGAWGRWYMRSM
jgi:hypothetical protein